MIFVFASLIGAASQFSIPNSDAPTYCQAFNPHNLISTPGTTPNQPGIVPSNLVNYQNGNLIENAVGLSVVALTLSFATIALAYILSRLVPNLGIRNWLQAEYWEITKTAILIAVIFSMITIVGNITTSVLNNPVTLTGGEITPVINGAETYLCGVNYNLMQTWGWMGLLGSGTGFWANLKLGNYDAIPVFTYVGLISGDVFVPFNNWMLQTGNVMIGPYGSVIGDTINLLLFPFTVLNLILIDALPSMAVVGLTFFIPLGLLFRALPFIRGIGGTMVAIGIGLAIVFPATLVMFNGVLMNYITQAVAVAPPPPPTNIGAFQCPFSNSFGLVLAPIVCTTMPGLIALALPQLMPAISFTTLNDQVGYLNGANVFSDNAIYQYMDIILAIASYITIQLIVITIDLVIVYSITDSIAKALGGSIRFQLGGKLRIAS
jgi:hypothetical protein